MFSYNPNIVQEPTKLQVTIKSVLASLDKVAVFNGNENLSLNK